MRQNPYVRATNLANDSRAVVWNIQYLPEQLPNDGVPLLRQTDHRAKLLVYDHRQSQNRLRRLTADFRSLTPSSVGEIRHDFQ